MSYKEVKNQSALGWWIGLKQEAGLEKEESTKTNSYVFDCIIE